MAGMDRLTKMFKGAYGLVKVKDNEQEIESRYQNTLRACFESWQRLGQYEDTGLTPEELASLRAEVEQLRRENCRLMNLTESKYMELQKIIRENAEHKADIEAGRMIRIPHKIGDKAYVIANCHGVRRSLDGTRYSYDGSPGTATGYYCAYDENWDECPLAKGREECDEKGYAVFEDSISAITIYLDDENEGPCVYIGLSNVSEYRDNKIYCTEEAARAALGEDAK